LILKIQTFFLAFVFFALLGFSDTNAQIRDQQLQTSQQFRLADRIIRVAEPGQLADTLNVWGDVNSPGRYLIPKSSTLPELISYSFGPSTIRDGQTNLDWSKVRVEVNISKYNPISNQESITNFEYRFNEPLPEGMRTFDLENNQVVSLQVKRRPSFVDYVRVIAPVLSSIATGFLIIDRL
jgi:protein involved in polysaccharide export with SLBB domain